MEPATEAPHLELGALALSEQPPQPPPQQPPRLLRTRCSAADAGAPCGFASLPDDVLFRVFAALPVDARVACARVCAAWREALVRGADAWRFWTRLDLSYAGDAFLDGVIDHVVLAGSAALARGHLQELYLESGNCNEDVTLDELVGVLRGNPEMRTLTLDGIAGNYALDPDKLQQLLAAAPALQRLDADWVVCHSSADSLPLLRAEPPYGPLRWQYMEIRCRIDPPGEGFGAVVDARRFAAVVAHAQVAGELQLKHTTWVEPAALEALADALLARTCRVTQLTLLNCTGLSSAYLPALARLLAGRDGAALAHAEIGFCESLFARASAADVEPVCVALRRTALTHVTLYAVGLTEKRKAALRHAAAANPRLLLEFSPQ